jgi:prepilin-type N-terminal cleavage/methylation domain-containing protein/prepilin-type processing-associated H-X9-DG protein
VTSSDRRGFTLIEVLVVIAIIAVLAGILFPVFARARDRARAISCLSNCKQVGAALQMYYQDYDEVLTPWFVKDNTRPLDAWRHDVVPWDMLIQPYAKNGQHTDDPSQKPSGTSAIPPNGIMKCPSFNPSIFVQAADMTDCDGPGALDSWIPPAEYFANYGIGFGNAAVSNGCTQQDPWFHFAGNDVRYPPMQTLATVVRPAETVIVADGFTGILPGGSYATAMGCESANSHQGGSNLVFIDGHARWIARNSERYLQRDQTGCWFKRFYTVDK